MFDTLLLATPEGTIEPWLATEWAYNDDNTVLTLTLRELERDGLVTRATAATRPPRVVYSLTPLGASLLPLFDALVAWWHAHAREIGARRASAT